MQRVGREWRKKRVDLFFFWGGNFFSKKKKIIKKSGGYALEKSNLARIFAKKKGGSELRVV